MGTGRVSNHQVPSFVKDFKNVALNVGSRLLSREKVAAHSVVTALDEGVTDYAGELARD
tara:strand:+ start:380 stop:556 length:177 start_codon:yes stop_codon:yes gene_type:complete